MIVGINGIIILVLFVVAMFIGAKISQKTDGKPFFVKLIGYIVMLALAIALILVASELGNKLAERGEPDGWYEGVE